MFDNFVDAMERSRKGELLRKSGESGAECAEMSNKPRCGVQRCLNVGLLATRDANFSLIAEALFDWMATAFLQLRPYLIEWALHFPVWIANEHLIGRPR